MSKVEVDQVTQQSGTTLTVGGGACKTAVVDATTVTLGRCGGTVSLASGATQSGFGRTGTVDWITTPKVTGDSPITGVTGKGYFLNTTAGTITINLPAGSAGDIISMADYAATWQTYNVTVTPNGADKIGAENSSATLSTSGQSVTFVYVDSTQGWINTMDSTSNVRGVAPYIVATGGTPCAGATCGDYKIHTFTGPGTFCVSNAGLPSGSNTVEYLVAAGGGGGASSCIGGAGGAGGFRFASPSSAPLTYPAKPLAGPANLPVSVQGYPIDVGGGGAGAVGPPSPPGISPPGDSGVNSSFSTITSAGGGGGGGSSGAGVDGGSGGGGDYNSAGGAGNTPATPVSQGNPGGTPSPGSPPFGPAYGASGGGGALAAGGNGSPTGGGVGGVGGGVPNNFGTSGESSGGFYYFSGGAAGADESPSSKSGGLGGGGGGGFGGGAAPAPNRAGGNGTINTGGGGGGTCGGGCGPHVGGAGGSGIVIIRYKFQ